jgi:hypothetical protein
VTLDTVMQHSARIHALSTTSLGAVVRSKEFWNSYQLQVDAEELAQLGEVDAAKVRLAAECTAECTAGS